jgi:hypothetical protein
VKGGEKKGEKKIRFYSTNSMQYNVGLDPLFEEGD